MAELCVVAGFIRAGRVLAAAGALALSGCGGGGVDSADTLAMASTAVGGQAMPIAKAIRSTDRALDVAIDGGGAFVLRDPRNGTQVLSRLGHFDLDALGRLVNDEGWLVMGVTDGQTPPTLEQLAPLPPIRAMLPPLPTRKVSLEINLPSRSSSISDGSAITPAFDPSDNRTYNNSTSLTVYDALGQSVALTFFFRKTDPLVWQVHVYANGEVVNADASGRSQPIATLTFRREGVAPINPANASLPLPPIVIDIPSAGGAMGHQTAAIAAVELDLSGLTAFGAPFGPTSLKQDGAPAARLTRATVKATGELVLVYDDLRVDDSRRLVLARTTVADRLHRYGASGWTCGRGCQSPVVAQPGQMLTGTLVAGALNAGL